MSGRGWSLLGLVVLAVTSGCAIVRGYRDRPLDESKIRRIERGVTTKAEILEAFGPPQEIDAREFVFVGDRLPEEQVLGARYFRYTYWRVNGTGLFLLLFNYLRADLKRDTLLVFFDDRDVVVDFAYSRDTDLLPTLGVLGW
ncbi:MAG: hypothetical protein KatS3mg076_1119 [Candidatus Binatia bacterium]|nr:MAG: hypothetical protein KatS3mg076_1119 [Candidatus Binatia bacterium]